MFNMGHVHLLVSLVMLICMLGSAAAVTYCPPLWTHYQSDSGVFCYRYFGKRVTWAEAEVTCAGFSSCEGEELAHTVSINTADEEIFITELRQTITGVYGGGDPGMWIGFTDRGREGRWGWSDKSSKNYTNWLQGEPSDSAQVENCARQIVPVIGIAVWVDSSCAEKHPFMCKMVAQ